MTAIVDTQTSRWAIAVVVSRDVLGVQGPLNMTYGQATDAAREAATLTITGDHPDTGERCTLTGVSPVVYWDTEYACWTLEENNWMFPDIRVARADKPGQGQARAR